jgi:hypothetical protein
MVGRRIFHELNGVLGNVDLHDAVGQSERGARGILRHLVVWHFKKNVARIKNQNVCQKLKCDSFAELVSLYSLTARNARAQRILFRHLRLLRSLKTETICRLLLIFTNARSFL